MGISRYRLSKAERHASERADCGPTIISGGLGSPVPVEALKGPAAGVPRGLGVGVRALAPSEAFMSLKISFVTFFTSSSLIITRPLLPKSYRIKAYKGLDFSVVFLGL
jgi:hypothetical protein